MKKMILILAISISTASVFASEKNVNQKVLNAFNTEFATAANVEWTVGDNYYKASFTYNEKYVFAYFNEEGELLGITRYISPVNLPLNLQTNLKKNYNDYWISDLFEVAKNSGTAYYITLENADTKMVLKSADGNNWSVHNKEKKS
jgi:hypothetical protein